MSVEMIMLFRIFLKTMNFLFIAIFLLRRSLKISDLIKKHHTIFTSLHIQDYQFYSQFRVTKSRFKDLFNVIISFQMAAR